MLRSLATLPMERAHTASCHSCGPSNLGDSSGLWAEFEDGQLVLALEISDVDYNSLCYLQISSSFIQIRNHLSASNKWRLAEASSQHMACLCPVCASVKTVWERRLTQQALHHRLCWDGENGLAYTHQLPQPTFQRKESWGHLVVHLHESLISWGTFQESLGGIIPKCLLALNKMQRKLLDTEQAHHHGNPGILELSIPETSYL